MSKPKLVQQVFEARYERGYRYLDRCGEAMLILEDMLPSETGKVWMPEDIIPTGAKMKCPDLDINVVFNAYQLVIDQNPADEPSSFAQIARLIFSTVTARFDIREIVRAGCRRFYLLPTDSVEEAESLSVKMAPFADWPMPPADGMAMIAGEATAVVERPDGTGYRFSVKPSQRRVEAPIQADWLRVPPRLQHENQRRALIDQLKRQAQREKAPVAGLLVDVDYYLVRPVKLDVDLFLTTALQISDKLTADFAIHR